MKTLRSTGTNSYVGENLKLFDKSRVNIEKL